jgi:hypothetical protein
VDGIFGPQLVVALGPFGGNPFVDGILGHNLLLSQASFFSMEFRLSRSLSHELLYFFMMEFWLSRSLSHEPFFFFHDGILAITKRFFTNFFLFS